MSKKEKMEETTSSEAPKNKNKRKKKKPLAGMLEAMEERSNPERGHKVASDYFKSFREERNLPDSNDTIDSNKQPVEQSKSTTAVDSAVTTQLTPDRSNKSKKSRSPKDKKDESKFEYLDATHSPSESKVYSIMYRECMRHNTNELRFGLTELQEKTGLSDKTIRVSIHSLVDKLSIEIVAPSKGIYGRKFRVYGPKRILEARRVSGIEIDPSTKKIITEEDSAVITAVSTGEGNAVVTTAVSAVRTTAVEDSTPYINTNKDDSKESSSNITKNDDDEIFNHKNHVISLYQKYTGNQWKKNEDDEFYEELKDTLPSIVEAAIISTLLRSDEGIESLKEIKGSIGELKQQCPPGYLSYLRNKLKESKESNGKPVSLLLPDNSYFQDEWLKKYVSGFPEEERARIIRLAEQFDYFMLKGGEKKEWVNNPTGAFVGLVRGDVNISLSNNAPTFADRVGEQSAREVEEAKRRESQKKSERESERIQNELKEAVSNLDAEEKEIFSENAKRRYKIHRVGGQDKILESAIYHIMHEMGERRLGDWRKIWEDIKSEDIE